MPFRPEASLLRVQVPALHTIDTTSAENLFGMWSLFSKTSHAMEDGKRLENLSWRLWNRETLCCASQSAPIHTTTTAAARRSQTSAGACDIPMPALSSSPDSAASNNDDGESRTSSSCRSIARPALRRLGSGASAQSWAAKHITPGHLEKMVISIQETPLCEPIDLPAPTPSFSAAEPSGTVASELPQLDLSSTQTPDSSHSITPQQSTSQATLLESSASTVRTIDSNESNNSQTVGSQDSSSTEMSTHSIVRGFQPGGAPSSYRSQTTLHTQPTPILKTSPSYHQAQPRKKGPVFTIGTSSSPDEDSSLESRFKSVLSESIKHPSGLRRDLVKKQTSFHNVVDVVKAAQHSPVFESDDEDDEVSESAIDDDDDSSDWEDSDQSRPASMSERDLFQRVDSRPNLTSRRSLLTTLMHEPDRARALANAASRSTPAMRRSRTSTPNGPSVATSPEPVVQQEVHGHALTRSKPIIMTTSNTHQQQLADSPRTTRRNMLSSELTDSLRKNLLWERQHKSTGNLAALKRRHTSNDVKNLKQLPEPAPILSHQNRARFTNDYFTDGLGEYHHKGW